MILSLGCQLSRGEIFGCCAIFLMSQLELQFFIDHEVNEKPSIWCFAFFFVMYDV